MVGLLRTHSIAEWVKPTCSAHKMISVLAYGWESYFCIAHAKIHMHGRRSNIYWNKVEDTMELWNAFSTLLLLTHGYWNADDLNRVAIERKLCAHKMMQRLTGHLPCRKKSIFGLPLILPSHKICLVGLQSSSPHCSHEICHSASADRSIFPLSWQLNDWIALLLTGTSGYHGITGCILYRLQGSFCSAPLLLLQSLALPMHVLHNNILSDTSTMLVLKARPEKGSFAIGPVFWGNIWHLQTWAALWHLTDHILLSSGTNNICHRAKFGCLERRFHYWHCGW